MAQIIATAVGAVKRADKLPKITNELPKITSTTASMPSLTSSTSSFTTPVMTVPASGNNPYILRQENPSGTVFIAVGACVGAIFLGFILYHLIVSFTASRLAKKTMASEKQLYATYQNNNGSAYGFGPDGSTGTTLNYNSEYQPSVAKLPLLTPSKSVLGSLGGGMGYSFGGSQLGDTSTIYQSEAAGPTTKHDMTKMFISPTAEVMQHKRVKSSLYGGSVTNLSFAGASTTNLVPGQGTNRNSFYGISEANNSDYSVLLGHSRAGPLLSSPGMPAAEGPSAPRKTIPSMYLEDLMDNKSTHDM